ncbi:MAG: hypothetical protein KGH64_04675, partial [Candidatus Micrarchaeota archaeon]|nr:hypothetical protein [Candidatus Micrarchaeota archaeon]
HFALDNVPYTVTENFVTPDYAGITINGVSYPTVYPNAQIVINSTSGSYAQVTKINYVPIQQSVNLILCSGKQDINTYYTFNISDNNYGYLYFAYYNTLLSISSSSNSSTPVNVTIRNVTSKTPELNHGYNKIIALNVSVVTSAPVVINMTQGVPCSLPAGSISVYRLMQDTWIKINNPQSDSASCTQTFPISAQSSVGVFYNSNKQQTTSITVSTTSSAPTTTKRITTSSATVHTTSMSTTTMLPGQCEKDIQCPLLTDSCSAYSCLVNKCINHLCQEVEVPLKNGNSNTLINNTGAQLSVASYSALAALNDAFIYSYITLGNWLLVVLVLVAMMLFVIARRLVLALRRNMSKAEPKKISKRKEVKPKGS